MKKKIRQTGTLTHPDGKKEQVVLETEMTKQGMRQRIVRDPLAGFLDPADAIVPCKTCDVTEGEPCKPMSEDEKETLKPGFVHFGRRVKRLLFTVKARSVEDRKRFETKAVKMLREHLTKPS